MVERVAASSRAPNILDGRQAYLSDRHLEEIDYYFNWVGRYPRGLSRTQFTVIYNHIESNGCVRDIWEDQKFICTIPPEQAGVYDNLFAESNTPYDLVVNSNLLLSAWVAYRYHGWLPLADLIQTGNIGLITAARRYDPSLGHTFATYAFWWIRSSVTREIRETARTVRLPSAVEDGLNKLQKVSLHFLAENGRRSSLKELAAAALAETTNPTAASGIRSALVAIDSGLLHLQSLDAPISQDSRSALADFVPDTGARNMEVEEESAEIREALGRAMATHLKPRDSKILAQIFFEDLTGREIGKRYGLSRQRVQQIKGRALKTLKQDGSLRALCEPDVPTFEYHSSAEDAAFALGVFADNKGQDILKMGKVKKPGREVSEKVALQKREEEDHALGRQTLRRAMTTKDVWNKVPARDKSILRMYYKGGADQAVIRKRLAAIFGITKDQLEQTVVVAMANLVHLLYEKTSARILMP